MTQYTKPTVLPAWGESANGADVLQPSNAEIQAGWPLSNVPPSRKRFNWILKYVAQGVRYMMQRGIPEWDAAEDYRINDRVMGSDGKTYRCIQAGINKDPTTQTAYWTRWGFTLAELDAERTTPPQFDNTTKTATTAFVQRALGNLPTPALLQQSAYMSAVGAGTVDAITAAFSPAIAALPAAPGTLSVFVRATGANTSATPTFKADGTAAKTIVKGNNVALLAGDIAGAGHWLELQYDATLDRWVLQNPTHGFGGTPPQFDNTARTATTAFVQRALGNYAGASSPSGATTLTAGDCGRIITFGGAGGYSVSFPAASAVPNGASVLIQNIASAAITIARQGTDSLVLGSQTATSVSCGVGEFFVATRSGGNWVLTGSLTLANTAAFGSSLGGAGYQRLPSGLILQWGRLGIGDIPRDYFSSTNFPITFPNNIFQVNLSLYSLSSGDSFDVSAAVTGHWQAGFGFTIQEWSGSTQNLELSYFAIGN